MAALPPPRADALRADLGLVQASIRAGVCPKRASAHDRHWALWQEFCDTHSFDPFLRNFTDAVPILQVFGQQYRDGRIAPSQDSVRARTVEDALRAVGQTMASLGSKDLRRDSSGRIDFRIQRQISSFHKTDSPTTRVKPVPVTFLTYLLDLALRPTLVPGRQAVTDMIVVAFYFLLRPGEYSGTSHDDHPFLLRDVQLFHFSRQLDLLQDPLPLIQASNSVALTFTRQKNGTMNERLIHALSGDARCCPVQAVIRLVLHHRTHRSTLGTPLASYYSSTGKLTRITATDVTEQLRHAACMLQHYTGISPTAISARSLRAGGAMALLSGNVDHNIMQMLGRWHGDAMMRYLHAQCLPAVKGYAKLMFNNGNYKFSPDESVPQLVDD